MDDLEHLVEDPASKRTYNILVVGVDDAQYKGVKDTLALNKDASFYTRRTPPLDSRESVSKVLSMMETQHWDLVLYNLALNMQRQDTDETWDSLHAVVDRCKVGFNDLPVVVFWPDTPLRPYSEALVAQARTEGAAGDIPFPDASKQYPVRAPSRRKKANYSVTAFSDDVMGYLTAGKDPFTGLLSKTSFLNLFQEKYEEIRDQYAAWESNGQAPRKLSLGLLVSDLDNFKQLNKRLGHHGADEILKKIGGRLLKYKATRYGGDEFVILISGYLSPDEVRSQAHQIGHRLSSSDYGLSMGLAIYPDPFRARHHMDLFAAADRALFENKEERNATAAKGTGYGIHEAF